MKHFVATFHTHLAALLTHRRLGQAGITSRMAPVPRRISSSCGTCAVLDDSVDPADLPREDVEGVYPRP
jgi:hypothetical protein